MASNTPISLRVSNKKAYVWDVHGEPKQARLIFAPLRSPPDIAILRSQHHICGILTGTLPHLSQQNVFLGVPLLLMPEEVVLLVDKGTSCTATPPIMPNRLTTGLAVLVDDQNAHHDPSPPDLANWDAERLRTVEAQLALAEEHEAMEALHPDRAMSEQAVQKRRAREAKKARLQVTPSPKVAPAPRNSSMPYTVHVPGASTFEWYVSAAHSYTTLAAARDAGVWDYPETPLQRARCAVFRDLWEQGYFMGSGIKFGGEYLVYPGTSPCF